MKTKRLVLFAALVGSLLLLGAGLILAQGVPTIGRSAISGGGGAEVGRAYIRSLYLSVVLRR